MLVNSPPNLLSIEEAKKRILEDLEPHQAVISLNISEAFNHVLAEAVYSPINVPAFDNSAMDGFAVNTNTLDSKRKLPITQTIAAGDVAKDLEEASVARIFTGAMVPDNADTVIAQENCQYSEHQVELPETISGGKNIRLKAQDVGRGDKVFAAGTRLRAQDIGMLASLGLAQVKLYKRIKVALVSTGNELLEPGTEEQHGKIYNSNRFMLEAFLRPLDVQVSISSIVGDDLQSTKHCFEKLASENDCVISTGGVSVGEADFVKQALAELGELSFWRLAIKPGKPFTYGRLLGKPFFGLPGNPVAVFVTFLIIVKPALKKLQGQRDLESEAVMSFLVECDFDYKANSKRQEYLRVKLKQVAGGKTLELYPNQSSGVLNSTCNSDGLAVLEVGRSIKKGDLLEFIPYSSL